jgi:hypothetical protein
MYKIVHLATGTYVMGNPGMDACFKDKIELMQILEAKHIVFLKPRGRAGYHAEIGQVFSPDREELEHRGDIIPKHQFEVMEVLDE